MLSEWLPVEILGKTHSDGRWDTGIARPRFGLEITQGPNPFLDLAGLDDNRYSIGGFVKVKPTADRQTHVDLQIITADSTFPLVVTDPARRVTWVGTGTGGWGRDWYGRYPEGYQILWREVLKNAL